MKINWYSTDEMIVAELAQRIAHRRLGRSLSQEKLAEESGVSLRTIKNLESGAVSVRLSTLIRVLRTLGLVGRVDLLIDEFELGPMDRLEAMQKLRKRAPRADSKHITATKPWKWGDE